MKAQVYPVPILPERLTKVKRKVRRASFQRERRRSRWFVSRTRKSESPKPACWILPRVYFSMAWRPCSITSQTCTGSDDCAFIEKYSEARPSIAHRKAVYRVRPSGNNPYHDEVSLSVVSTSIHMKGCALQQ